MAGTIICYGDSNTFGYDSRIGTQGRFPKDIRWTGILDEQIEYSIKNHGICGRCIPATDGRMEFLYKQLKGWAKKESPVWLWIMLGTNDLLGMEHPLAEKVAEQMHFFLQKLLDTTEVRSGKIQVMLLAPPELKRGSWVENDAYVIESQKLGVLYEEVARVSGVKCIDCGKWDVDLLYDGVHLSEEGHATFAMKIKDIMQKEKRI